MLISLKPRPVGKRRKTPSANFGENRNLAPRNVFALLSIIVQTTIQESPLTYSVKSTTILLFFLSGSVKSWISRGVSGSRLTFLFNWRPSFWGLVEAKKRSIPPNVLFSSQGLWLHRLRRRLTHFEHLNYQLLQKEQSSRLLICLRSVKSKNWGNLDDDIWR
jgi:hypothetical protein